ncbi:G5 domain-containing protein [Candidatus Saccharibacteria bacterium]|nr:G5 domain-containing protein [Candidatus Saccharibacteria bacterium]
MKMRYAKGKLSLLAVGILSFVSIFVASGILNAVSASAEGDEPHIISIYDGDSSVNVKSDATTVREALLRAKIELNPGDKIEPALDEEINSKNFNINIYRGRDALVLDGEKKIYVRTASSTPSEVALDSGVELLEADIVKVVPFNNLLETGTTVAYKVVRAKTVHLNFYGKQIEKRTQAETIADFLVEQNIDSNTDKTWVSLLHDTKIADGMSFAIQPQGKQTITIDEDIPFKETTTYDYELDYGKREIVKPGKLGQKTVTYEVEMHDGIEVSRQTISEIVVKNAETQEVKVGMKVYLPTGSHEDWMAAVGIAPSDYGYVNYIITHESHWNPLAKNRSSGATGLCQALPGKKMASAGADWETNPITQLRWCNGYAVGRYGSWRKAYEFWTVHKWW